MNAPLPRTTFVNGINPFSGRGVLSDLQIKPKKAKTMSPKTPGCPAKTSSTKTPPKDEDYSTPYQPPVPTVTYPLSAVTDPTIKESSTVAPKVTRVVLPDLNDIQIDDDVPLPDVLRRPDAKARIAILTGLLGKLQPGKSAALPMGVYATLSKVVSATHKSGPARFATRKDKAAQTLRVWRVL